MTLKQGGSNNDLNPYNYYMIASICIKWVRSIKDIKDTNSFFKIKAFWNTHVAIMVRHSIQPLVMILAFINEDPALYTGTSPSRRITWTQTARRAPRGCSCSSPCPRPAARMDSSIQWLEKYTIDNVEQFYLTLWSILIKLDVFLEIWKMRGEIGKLKKMTFIFKFLAFL